MTEIPADIRKAAAEAHAAFARSSDTRNLRQIIEEAILAERERCADEIEWLRANLEASKNAHIDTLEKAIDHAKSRMLEDGVSHMLRDSTN